MVTRGECGRCVWKEKEAAGKRKALGCWLRWFRGIHYITLTSGSSKVPLSIMLRTHSNNQRTTVALRLKHKHTHACSSNSFTTNYIWIKQHKSGLNSWNKGEKIHILTLVEKKSGLMFRGLARGWNFILIKYHLICGLEIKTRFRKNNPNLKHGCSVFDLCVFTTARSEIFSPFCYF